MEYTIERLDPEGWVIIGSDLESGWAQHYMRAQRRLFPKKAFRVVERPSGTLVLCTGGPPLGEKGE